MEPTKGTTVLVGGIGQLYQGDLDVGRRAAERLAAENLGRGVVVEDFYFGAVAVAQEIEDVAPDALVLVGAAARGRSPGAVERKAIDAFVIDHDRAQAAVREAVTGYVTIDLVVEVAAGFGVLPAHTVVIEVEPRRREVSETLSPEAAAGLERALEMVRDEVSRLVAREPTASAD